GTPIQTRRVTEPIATFLAALLDQFGHGFAVVEDVHGPAAAVGERLGGINAERLIEGAQDLRGGIAAVLGIFAACAGGADGLTHLEAAARDESRHHWRPVIAAAVVAVDFRGAAKLTPHNGHHILIHAPII